MENQNPQVQETFKKYPLLAEIVNRHNIKIETAEESKKHGDLFTLLAIANIEPPPKKPE